jgi:hypothetical protein
MLLYVAIAVTILIAERIYRMASDPLAALNAILAQLQTDISSLQAASAAVLAYLQQLVAGQAAGTVTVGSAELATAVINATAIDTALQAVTASQVAGEPAASTTPATSNVKK